MSVRMHEVMCKLFRCHRYSASPCCRDCKDYEECNRHCMNSPSRCGQAARKMKKLRKFIHFLVISGGVTDCIIGSIWVGVTIIVAIASIYFDITNMVLLPGYLLVMIGEVHIIHAYLVDAVKYKTRGNIFSWTGIGTMLVVGLLKVLVTLK